MKQPPSPPAARASCIPRPCRRWPSAGFHYSCAARSTLTRRARTLAIHVLRLLGHHSQPYSPRSRWREHSERLAAPMPSETASEKPSDYLLIQLGVGQVGSAVVSLVQQHTSGWRQRFGLGIHYYALADSSGFVIPDSTERR